MKKIALFLILNLIFGSTGFAQGKAGSFLLLDAKLLNRLKDQYHQGDTGIVRQVKGLLHEADTLLKSGPYSVTFEKVKTAPGGDKHDYISQAPYWWPDSSKANGLPYIRKDGKRNPEIYLLHDVTQKDKFCNAVKKLALAYYFTGDERYAKKAVQLMQVWFIDADTRMNPNLNYAQYIPGINDGRGIGIIETRFFTNVPDAIALLQGSKAVNVQLTAGVKLWYKQFLTWLLNSRNGKDELSQTNNHGTNYDMQIADYALFVGDRQLAEKVIKEFTIPRMAVQFTPEGKQPLELVRTRSWDYSNMNLEAWSKLAILADKVGIDLWHRQTADGKGLKATIAYLIPFALQQQQWPYQEIGKFEYGNLKRTVHAAEGKYQDLDFKDFYTKFPKNGQLQLLE